MQFARITTNPQKMGGVPCIRSLRIPVTTIFDMFADGMRDQEILQAFPDLEAEDIQEVLQYVATTLRVNLETQGLKEVVQQTVQETMNEVLRKEKFAFIFSQMPCVSDEEQADIEDHFGSPSDYDRSEFVDMTDWVRNETSFK
ncbi:DUF433 domain-containing protein [Pseudanabaena cinerea]|uniref:DUF433 domain-containing protein n=1 Tax=Pseudanabaena cinerea TaxID=2661616 RepID=UPI0018EF97B7|nr:DUF433 domain-containing protein [Pseudanabaena cinerea]